MKLLIKFPTRARPARFKETFELYQNKLSGKHDVKFLVTMDTDDDTMNNPEMQAWLDSKGVCYCYGESKTKIEAINANMADQEFDVLLLASDDMIPEMDGYDDIICSRMEANYPDTFGVLHFNDGRAGKSLNTLSIMGKKMYDHFGYIYHPQYASLWCDNEFHQETVRLGKVSYFDEIIIKHAWVDATGNDALNVRNEKFYYSDQLIFEMRKAKGFPKETVNVAQNSREYREAMAVVRKCRTINRRR